jgi:2-polyprenyl-3-methyl-5-hydroxy-6-metoxy-1,4-benzoquinol methylase
MNCRICAGQTRHVFDLRSQRRAQNVPVFRCASCDAYFSDGGQVDYDDVDLTGFYRRHEAVIRARFERVFSRIETLIRPGRFLDIGAGMGYSLEVATARGWTSRGLEPNRALARSAKERGLAVENGYLDASGHGEFDFVLIDNVVEHVADATNFLRNAGRQLSGNGLMLVAIPPLDWLRKGLGSIRYLREHVSRPQLNVFVEADEHVNMLGRRAMKALAEKAGLRLKPIRLHHSRVYDNAAFRALGLDDGYYVITHA